MENEAGLGTAPAEGHVQGVGDQLGAHVVGHGPADDCSAGQVDNRGQVSETGPGPDVRDVSYITVVELSGGA